MITTYRKRVGPDLDDTYSELDNTVELVRGFDSLASWAHLLQNNAADPACGAGSFESDFSENATFLADVLAARMPEIKYSANVSLWFSVTNSLAKLSAGAGAVGSAPPTTTRTTFFHKPWMRALLPVIRDRYMLDRISFFQHCSLLAALARMKFFDKEAYDAILSMLLQEKSLFKEIEHVSPILWALSAVNYYEHERFFSFSLNFVEEKVRESSQRRGRPMTQVGFTALVQSCHALVAAEHFRGFMKPVSLSATIRPGENEDEDDEAAAEIERARGQHQKQEMQEDRLRKLSTLLEAVYTRQTLRLTLDPYAAAGSSGGQRFLDRLVQVAHLLNANVVLDVEDHGSLPDLKTRLNLSPEAEKRIQMHVESTVGCTRSLLMSEDGLDANEQALLAAVGTGASGDAVLAAASTSTYESASW
eukprot:g3751.t1